MVELAGSDRTMQVTTPDRDRLNALPELAPPPDLEASVLELALAEIDDAVEGSAAPDLSPAVSGFEIFVHGTIVAAYVVYAAHAAIGMLDRALPF